MRRIKNILVRTLACLLLSLFAWSCAQVVNPSGGAKDSTPPKASKYVPDSAALNFNSKSVIINFNEYIQLRDLNSQFIVSPPMNPLPDVKVKGKSLIISFKDSLKKNTTYTLSFGNAIQDITENNAADGFQYVFSTGSFLDSLSLSGKVQNAFDAKTEKGILVMLYREQGDSLPHKRIPDYFTKTKEDGSYSLHNIRAGTYKAFVLKDINSNYKYDSPEEAIAFADAPIEISKNSTLDLALFKEIPPRQFLKKSAAVDFGHLFLAFNKPVEKPEINSLNFFPKKEWKLEEWNATKDTLNIWLIDAGIDTLKLEIRDNDKIIDTLRIKLITRELASKNSRGKKFLLETAANTTKEKPFDINKDLLLEFSHPLKDNPLANIHLMQGNKAVELKTKSVLNSRVFTYEHNALSYDTIYTLSVDPGAFTDIFGLKNDTVKITFRTYPEKYYGTVKIKITLPQNSEIPLVQLMDEAGNVNLQSNSYSNGELYANMLHPGKYKVRLIFDTNKNGKWDTGNYLKHQQPEKVLYYPGTLTVRSNWDLEQEWKIAGKE